MDSGIVSALIGLIGAIIGYGITLYTNKPKVKYLKIDSNNMTIPFACAESGGEKTAYFQNNGYTFNFDFDNSEKFSDFVSLVFPINNQNIYKNKKSLKFDLQFKDGNFSKIKLEIKSLGGVIQYKDIIKRQKDTIPYELDLTTINEEITEICFVIPKEYVLDINHHGSFIISNIYFE